MPLCRLADRLTPSHRGKTAEADADRAIADFCSHTFTDSNAASVRLTGLDLRALGYDVPAEPPAGILPLSKSRSKV